MKLTFLKTNSVIGSVKPYECDLAKVGDLGIGQKVCIDDAFDRLVSKVEKSYETIEPKPGGTQAESILNIFLHDGIILGDKTLVLKNKELFLSGISYFISKGLPVEFCLLGLPHKMPNRLMTGETMAGGAEAAMLLRLKFILNKVEKVYTNGAIINFFYENKVFSHLAGLEVAQTDLYIASVQNFIDQLGLKNRIVLKDLLHYEKLFPAFGRYFLKNIEHYKKQVRDELESARLNFFFTTNDKSVPIEESLEIFNPKIKLDELTPLARYHRIDFWEKTLPLAVQYLAYNKTRREVRMMDKAAPHNIKLTVAPKAGSIGIKLVSKDTCTLPYYGYVVFERGELTIKYWVDIVAVKTKFTAVTDNDGKVWYFEKA